MNEEIRKAIVDAIRQQRKLQLAYRRSDETHSLHTVAPVDLQLGDTTATVHLEYLWAYCYAQERAERHRFDRIVAARVLDEGFEAAAIVGYWPTDWTLPTAWRIDRDWND